MESRNGKIDFYRKDWKEKNGFVCKRVKLNNKKACVWAWVFDSQSNPAKEQEARVYTSAKQ